MTFVLCKVYSSLCRFYIDAVHIGNRSITRVIKMGFKQIGSDFEHVIDDVELLMWTTVSLNTDFFTKENADRFASLGLFAFLVNCFRVLLKSLVI